MTSGGGKTIACGACHGADLKGLGPVPGIAGRSPSYLVRQMYDMQAGARKGVWTALMTKVVSQAERGRHARNRRLYGLAEAVNGDRGKLDLCTRS